MSNKENVYLSVAKDKAESKDNIEKRKGLRISADNYSDAKYTSVQKSSIGNAQFEVYKDGLVTLRARPRENVCKKEIIKTKEKEAADSVLHIPRRARSVSNTRNRFFSDKKRKLNSNICPRSSSESRKTSVVQYNATPINPKTKHLSNDVKKRTLTSIELWRNKMRKHASNVSKNSADIYSNALCTEKANIKTKLQENAVANNCVKINRKSNVISSGALNAEVLQNRTTILRKNLQESTPVVPPLVQYISSKAAIIPQDNPFLSTQVHNSANYFSENSRDNSQVEAAAINIKIKTPSDSFALRLTPMKVRHEKCMVVSSTERENKVNDIQDIQVPYERHYLNYTLNTERTREEIAPSLSSRFLRGNVNAEQRKIIIGYLIHLDAHNNYSSHVIYQTVKLFDLAIDRILVETDNIQLLCLACLWITLKREGNTHKIPSATSILQLAKDVYINEKQQLLMYEIKILEALKFNIRFADPYSLLFYYIQSVKEYSNINSKDIPRIYLCGSYLIDLSMFDANLCDISESVRALVAARLSLCFIYWNDANVEQAWRQFRRSLKFTEWEERVSTTVIKSVISHILESENRTFDSYNVYKKYSRSLRGKISIVFLDKVKKVLSERDTHTKIYI